jgi:predicted N-acyltransferase
VDIQIINPITYPDWDDLLLSTPGHSFFHSSPWAKVLLESYGYTPKYFTLLERNKLIALLPVMEINSFLTGKRAVSLPFTDSCDPIILDGVPFAELWNCVIEHGKRVGWQYVELRGGQDFLHLDLFSSTYLEHTVDLAKGEEQIYARLRDTTRRNIRKAVKEGVTVEISQSLDSTKEFYRLNCITRKDHGLPPQPHPFFKKVYEHVLASNLGFIVLASFGGKPVAGAIYFQLKEEAVYKYGASEKGVQHLRANNLVMWEGIRECIHRGCTTLSLGRTDPRHKGLLQFKTGWNATEQQISYYRYDLRKNSFVSGSSKVTGFHNKIFRKIPIPLLKTVGSVFYRHAG